MATPWGGKRKRSFQTAKVVCKGKQKEERVGKNLEGLKENG